MKYTFFNGGCKYHDGEGKISAIIYDGACIIFGQETKISTEKQRKQGGEIFKFRLSGERETDFRGRPSFYFDGTLDIVSAGSLLRGGECHSELA